MSQRVVSFSINQKGVQRIFLRVKDEGSTGLIFLPVGTGRFESKSGSSWDIKDFHFTVHPPNKGSGYTIKKSVIGANAEEYESTAYFAIPDHDGFRSVVYARTVNDMTGDTESALTDMSNDIPIYNCDTSSYIVYYALLVSTDAFSGVADLPFRLTSQQIGSLNVHVVSALFPIPPLRGVDTATFITSEPWQGRSREKIFLLPNEVARPWGAQLERILILVARLASLTFQRLRKYREQGKLGDMPEEAMRMASYLLDNAVKNVIAEPA